MGISRFFSAGYFVAQTNRKKPPNILTFCHIYMYGSMWSINMWSCTKMRWNERKTLISMLKTRFSMLSKHLHTRDIIKKIYFFMKNSRFLMISEISKKLKKPAIFFNCWHGGADISPMRKYFSEILFLTIAYRCYLMISRNYSMGVSRFCFPLAIS